MKNLRFKSAGLIMLGLWCVPIARGVKFLADTHQIYQETQSINSFTDYSYARGLFLSYFFAFAVSAGIVWIHQETKIIGLWIQSLLCGLGVLFVICLKPENVVILIPPTIHLLIALAYLALGLSALMVSFLKYTLGRSESGNKENWT